MKRRKSLLEKIRKKLIERRTEFVEQVRNLSQDVSDHQVADSGDEALILSMGKLQDTLQQSDVDELRLIDDALDRIDKGDYGVCIDCGGEISEKRLDCYPYVARCIVCQEDLEK